MEVPTLSDRYLNYLAAIRNRELRQTEIDIHLFITEPGPHNLKVPR